MQTGSSGTLILAGNLVKPRLSLYGTEWRERGYGLCSHAPFTVYSTLLWLRLILFICVYVFLFVLEMFKYIELVYLFSVLEVFSAWRNQFLFSTGCVKCCTFLFIDVIECRLVCVTFLCCVFVFDFRC